MKYASDFRGIARQALTGRWTNAVIAGLLATLLGGVATNAPEITLNVNDAGTDLGLEVGGQQFFSFSNGLSEQLAGFLTGGAAVILLVALAIGVAYYILGSVIEVGYSRFNLDVVDRRQEPEIGTLFGFFAHWKTAAATRFLKGLYVFLWSLLFVIPGIVAGYSYAMTGYILAEHPELTAGEAIEQSKVMMEGNRGRLFCLQFSFIGWELLSALTLGIGGLWIRPYREAAIAAFYREVSGTEYIVSSGETPPSMDGAR